MVKKWYQSKLVWLNVISTGIGALNLVAEYLSANEFSSAGMALLFSGMLGVVLRVWFTNTRIER